MSPRYRIRRERGWGYVWMSLLGQPWRWTCRDKGCPSRVLLPTMESLRTGNTPTHESALRKVEDHERQWHRGTL